MTNFNKFILLQYATAHGLVDLGCVVSLFSVWHIWSPGIILMQKLILLYALLAFGLQPFLGWLSDIFDSPKLFAILGCLLSAVGIVLLPFSFWLTVFFIGIGNAFFHVGGGSISLDLTKYRSSAPGIFVAPGAIGLALGTIIGKAGFINIWIFSGILIIMATVLFFLKTSSVKEKITAPLKNKFWLISLFLILTVILGRSLIGFSWTLPWKSNLMLFLLITLTISLGKGVGGILADKYGFKFIALLGLLASAPLLIFYSNFPIIAIFGIFLFQFTIPVTLAATYRLLPNRPGLAFGLPCLALLIGAIPILTQNQKYFSGFYFLLFSFLLISIITYSGLKLIPNYSKETNI